MFCPIPKCLTSHLTYPLVFVNEDTHALKQMDNLLLASHSSKMSTTPVASNNRVCGHHNLKQKLHQKESLQIKEYLIILKDLSNVIRLFLKN